MMQGKISTPIQLFYSTYCSPIGKIFLLGRDSMEGAPLSALVLEDKFFELSARGSSEVIECKDLFEALRNQLADYFSGKKIIFDYPLNPLGTAFQKQVWKRLIDIPYGKTISYKELAASLGHPKASRAAANACGKNPIPIIVPCHRVIRSSGELGGYSLGNGVGLKSRLLKIEWLNRSRRHPPAILEK
jgi:methylated-DNA-[protein]-cysteine S-methyltransferase